MKLMKNFAAVVCAVIAASCLWASPASAKYMKSMKVSPASNAFGGHEIEVVSDGERWTRINEGSHQVRVNVDIQAGSGWRIWSAYIGVPNADFGGTSLSTDAVRRLGGGKDVKTIKRTETHTFHTDDLVLDRASIINLCNSAGRPPTQEHIPDADIDIAVGIKAYFQTRKQAKGFHEGGDDFGRSETAYTRVPVKIKCLAGPSRIKAPPEPFSIDLSMMSLEEKCPQKTEVRAFIKYKVPATARFRFVHNGKKSVWHVIKARKISEAPKPGVTPGARVYLVERVKYYHLDPGEHRFRIEMATSGKKSAVKTVKIKCPPFKVNSMWLNYDVKAKGYCPHVVKEKLKMKATRPGKARFRIKTQAGLVVHSGVARFVRKGLEYVAVEKRKLSMGAFNSDMMAEIEDDPSSNSGWTRLQVECLERLYAELTVRDVTTSTKCPRQGSIKVKLGFNMFKQKVRYRVDCTGNRSWTRNTISKKSRTGPDFGVTDFLNFDVTKTEQVNCALKDMYDGGRVIALSGHKFQCVKRANEPVSNDLSAQPNPTHDRPKTPGKLVIDPPRVPPVTRPGKIVDPVRIVCRNGTVRKRSCYCPRKHKKVKTGPNAWRCDRIVVVVPPKKGGASLTSSGGKRKKALQLKRKGKKRRAAGKRRKNRAMRLR